ncbi:MAG: hypothetical protein SF053_05570 [Bacteroidia bacterium]|nr:hypothetical protein [Bacteroidia bacterium]
MTNKLLIVLTFCLSLSGSLLAQDAAPATYLPTPEVLESLMITSGGNQELVFRLKLYTASSVDLLVRDAVGETTMISRQVLQPGEQTVRLPLEGLGQGIYFVRLDTDLVRHEQMVILDRMR